jgi:hypothetical protein
MRRYRPQMRSNPVDLCVAWACIAVLMVVAVWPRESFPPSASPSLAPSRLRASVASPTSAPSFALRELVVLVPVGGGFNPQLFRDTWLTDDFWARVVFVGECAGCDWAVTPDAERGAAHGQWPKVREMFVAALEKYPAATWFMKIDSDTYVVAKRLEAFVRREISPDSLRPRYVGYNVSSVMGEYAQGGAGYLLSRAALEGLFEKPECGAVQSAHPYLRRNFEDLNMGWCLKANGVALEPWDVFMEAPIHVRVKDMRDSPEEATVRLERAVTLHFYKSREDYLAIHKRVVSH